MLAALTPFIASTVTHMQEIAVATAPAEKAAAPTTPGIGFVYVCPTAEGVEFEPYAMYISRATALPLAAALRGRV